MKTVLVLATVLALAHQALAQTCASIPQYNETFVPDCAGNDVYVLWPNYENFSQYYRCQGVGNPKLANCATNTYFSYYLQVCNACEDYLPAPACSYLKTQNKPNCKPSGSAVTTTTTTKAPVTTTTKAPVTTTTKAPTNTTVTAPTAAPGTTTTGGGVPQPPSPSTVDPNVPTPPTPAPTPPTVAPNPPSEAPPV